VNKGSKSTRSGVSKEETTETPQASQSSSVENPSTLATSDTTAKAKSPKASQATPNLQDIPNAVRLIQALGAKLGALVEWKRLTLGDGREVFALCFPVSKWEVDPTTKELRLK
jgi:hypothetical protein